MSEPEHPEHPETGDSLPAELDVTAFVGPYLFPSTRRRRATAAWYVAIAVGCLAGFVASDNGGLLAAAGLLGLIAAYHLATAWPVGIDQTDALARASAAVGFPVGHASGLLGARGLRARPAWRILLFSADEPPTRRGLVELDAVDGTVLGQYTEDNPDDNPDDNPGDDLGDDPGSGTNSAARS